MDMEEDQEEGSEEEVFSYGDMHKLILQGIMSAGFLDAKGVKNLFLGACKALDLDPEQRTTMPAVQKAVREINEHIKAFDMAIRSASCELTGKKFYVFLVTVEKPIMKLQTLFSKAELELFQKLMTAVLRKYDNYAVPMPDCLNLAREIDTRNFSMEMAEAFLHKMIAMQYLAKYFPDPKKTDFEITIGIRTIREFEPILREVYDDVMTNCHLCKMIMLHGNQCHKCNVFVHKACLEKYLKTCKTCPGCKCNWIDKPLARRVRQRVNEDHSTSAAHGSANAASTSTRRRPAQKTGTGKEVNMPILQPMVSPSKRARKSGSPVAAVQSPQKSGAKGRGRGTRRAVILSSSDEDAE